MIQDSQSVVSGERDYVQIAAGGHFAVSQGQ